MVARFYELLGCTQAYAFPAEGIPVFVTLSRGHDEPWGERLATVRDPAGNKLDLGAPVREA